MIDGVLCQTIQSVTADLKNPAGREAIRKFIGEAECLFTTSAGVAERLEIDQGGERCGTGSWAAGVT